jgi:hypothetical protein
MKALSIKQPWASLIAHGIKDIENRTWRTHFRGKIYIHTSAKDAGALYERLNDKQIEAANNHWTDYPYPNRPLSAIIGEVDIIDCVVNHHSIWAEKTNGSYVGDGVFVLSEKPIYNWVLANPVLYDKPILNIKGKLSFWEFRNLIECRCCTNKETDEEMHLCKRCEQEYCVDCQAGFNQFSQIDYNCCQDCENRDDRD